MKNRITAVCVALFVIGLIGFVAYSSSRPKTQKSLSLEALRADLKEKVSKGSLSPEQAQVRLAEAMKKNSRSKPKVNLSPAQEAEAAELRSKVASGRLTAEEARARFGELKKEAGTAAGEK